MVQKLLQNPLPAVEEWFGDVFFLLAVILALKSSFSLLLEH